MAQDAHKESTIHFLLKRNKIAGNEKINLDNFSAFSRSFNLKQLDYFKGSNLYFYRLNLLAPVYLLLGKYFLLF